MNQTSYRFSYAITRAPAESAAWGLRGVDHGNPDIGTLLDDHAQYVIALGYAGVEVTVLGALEAFPDSLFVEDTALCLPEGAVVLRPGAPTRFGEADAMAPHLGDFYTRVERLQGPGTIEGGDILTVGREILVGVSDRTTSEGAAELAAVVADWGYTLREVETPSGVLHFKSECSLLDDTTILATTRLSSSGCFGSYTVIDVAEGEEPAANSIRVNDVVFMPEGFPLTAERVRDAGFVVMELANVEGQKIDGGLSCLSLRFTPS